MEAVKRSISDSHQSSIEKSGKTGIKSLTKKNKKSKKKDRKRKHSSYDYNSEDESPRKKSKSKHKKKCKKRHKHGKEKKEKLSKEKYIKKHKSRKEEEPDIGPEVPATIFDKAQSMAPMSKEEWSKQQRKIRRVYDEESGRTRLVRGDREIIEEIVSRDRHREINRQATQADGHFFQAKIKKKVL